MVVDGNDKSNTEGFTPSHTLCSRTYIGLLIAQFLAAFNDQAIHASAMFFAINTQTLTEAQAISLMPILFYAPWAVFCTMAGYFADRYSKRNSLIFWKFVEIAITAFAVVGFYLGTHEQESLGSWIVLSSVFLMGLHSAFFVPAKYGVMPEILQPHLLSKGNGLLESLSFLAVILGTVSGGVLSFLFLRQETIIGLILFGLAVIGALASLLIRKMPAANPDRSFPAYLYGPLWNNLKTLVSAKSLVFAVIGLAFFTFIVAFMRATVYMLGESQNPRWDELRTSAVVGTVALGIGLGSPLAGWISGRKVELGLIALGGIGMILGCILAATTLSYLPGLIACIILIGFSTGFYLVPLFTLLQYRAPKTSKGDMIATSNFINVTGAIAASLLFAIVVFAAKRTGFVPTVPMQDGYAEGELITLELNRGRPVYFEVQHPETFKIIMGGSKLTQETDVSASSVWHQIVGNGKNDTGVIIETERGINARTYAEDSILPGDVVKVAQYEVRGVQHFHIREETSSLPKAYDQQELPEFLFLGAGFMTLVTLCLLIWRLPDLLRRGTWVVRSLFTRKILISGIQHIPTREAAVIVTNTDDPRLLRYVRSATDRYILLVDGLPDEVPISVSSLNKGNLVAVRSFDEKKLRYLEALPKEISFQWLPVFCSLEEKELRITFGPKVSWDCSIEELQNRIEELKNP